MEKLTGTSGFNDRKKAIDDYSIAGDEATRTAVYNTDSTSGVLWRVRPGQEIVPHCHPNSDDIWICVQGAGVFYPELGVEEPVAKGDIIVSPKGACHGMRNTGDDDFVFVGILAPVPADYQALA